MRRITSRFSAKRFFQASSSANEARICDAYRTLLILGQRDDFFLRLLQ
jgi:hypothetical protein